MWRADGKENKENYVGSFYGPGLEVMWITATHIPLARTCTHGTLNYKRNRKKRNTSEQLARQLKMKIVLSWYFNILSLPF